MATNLFYHTSRRVTNEITEIFDFVWPTAAALWNLRWQVNGYLQTRPKATILELNNRFVEGSGIHGANIKRACVELSWEQQQQELSKFLLFNLVSLYETWVAGVLDELGIQTQDRLKQLQFPTRNNASGKRTGAWKIIDDITSVESIPLRDTFYSQLLLHKKNSKSHLDNLLKCYRYFKECRNCLAHNGGVADDRLEDTYNDFSQVSVASLLNIKEAPAHDTFKKGDPVSLRLRGVVGFCDVILRLVATIDAELSRSLRAEKNLIKYWRILHGKRTFTLKPGSETGRSYQIKRYINKLGLPIPTSTIKIEKFLLDNKLVSR